MSAYPVSIYVGFTFLVQITFICSCSDCNRKLAYCYKSYVALLRSISRRESWQNFCGMI